MLYALVHMGWPHAVEVDTFELAMDLTFRGAHSPESHRLSGEQAPSVQSHLQEDMA